MKNLSLYFVILLLSSSCSMATYSIKQAYGQLALVWRARDNKEILKDKQIKDEYKRKIRLIEEYKKYFYKYFDMQETAIYAQTTFLDSDAVSYLVIASPIDEVRPVKHSFPVVGSFPYLGFFNKTDAEEFEKELSPQYFTYVRPVYAYSTLNQLFFYDRILSSFFQYDDYSLAELIFHELTHTVFFVKDDVNFNESLAQYIGEELAQEYFKFSEEQKKQRELKQIEGQSLRRVMANFVREYNRQLKKSRPKTKSEATALMHKLYQEKYSKIYQDECQRWNLTNCQWDINQWNNARMAEFLTYQSKQSLVKQLKQKHNFSLKQLLEHLMKKHQNYNSGQFVTFTKYLKHEEKL